MMDELIIDPARKIRHKKVLALKTAFEKRVDKPLERLEERRDQIFKDFSDAAFKSSMITSLVAFLSQSTLLCHPFSVVLVGLILLFLFHVLLVVFLLVGAFRDLRSLAPGYDRVEARRNAFDRDLVEIGVATEDDLIHPPDESAFRRRVLNMRIRPFHSFRYDAISLIFVSLASIGLAAALSCVFFYRTCELPHTTTSSPSSTSLAPPPPIAPPPHPLPPPPPPSHTLLAPPPLHPPVPAPLPSPTPSLHQASIADILALVYAAHYPYPFTCPANAPHKCFVDLCPSPTGIPSYCYRYFV